MTIPQVNAGATDRNRKQTLRICELKGWTIDAVTFRGPVVIGPQAKELNERGERIAPVEDLHNGSFTLCVVVGMFKERGWQFHPRDVVNRKGGYWMRRRADMVWEDMGYIKDVHSLTENMDSFIRMLETKGGKDG